MFTTALTTATALVLSASLAAAALPGHPVAEPATSQAVESYDVAGTNGMDRRGGRRDTRQDCRQSEGAVGQDKRNCKQDGRG